MTLFCRLSGMLRLRFAGNMAQLFVRGAAGCQTQLARQYGSVVKLHGFLCVRITYPR